MTWDSLFADMFDYIFIFFSIPGVGGRALQRHYRAGKSPRGVQVCCRSIWICHLCLACHHLHWKSKALWHELHWISLSLGLDALTHISTFNTSNLQGGRCQTKCFSYFSLLRERRAWAQICQQSNIWGPVGDEWKQQRYRFLFHAPTKRSSFDICLGGILFLFIECKKDIAKTWTKASARFVSEWKNASSWRCHCSVHWRGKCIICNTLSSKIVSCVTASLTENVFDD